MIKWRTVAACAAAVVWSPVLFGQGALTITSPSSYAADVGHAVNFQFTGSGGIPNAGYFWEIAPDLPSGVSLNGQTGALTGAASATSPATQYTVTLFNGELSSVQQTFTLTINTTPSIPQVNAPDAILNTAYSYQLQATGGTLPYVNWTLTSSALPTGLTLDSDGLIHGTPTNAAQVGSNLVFISVQDTFGFTAYQTFNIRVDPQLIVPSFALGEVGAAYSTAAITVVGGTAPYTFSVASGSLPPGLAITPGTGVISGTPTASGTYTFTLQMQDSFDDSPNTSTTAQLSIAIDPGLAIATQSIAAGEVGAPYSVQLAGTGGQAASYVWSTPNGHPPGITISASGLLSGTPTTANANGVVAVLLQDGLGGAAQTTFSLPISAGPAISSPALAAGDQNTAYSSPNFTVTGGVGPYTWSLAGGALPPGILLTPNPTDSTKAVLTGTPSAAGTYTFTLRVQDTPGSTSTSGLLSITIHSALQISTASLPTGEVGVGYSSPLAATGGVPNATLNWGATLNTIPAGLSLSASGVLSGTPTVATANAQLAISVSDGIGTAQKNVPLTIVAATAVTTTSVPNGVPNQVYTPVNLTASGGVGPYHWIATGLPAGMSLSDPGVLSGTPTTAAVTPFSVGVTDSLGGHATAQLTFTAAAPLVIAVPHLSAGELQVLYSYQFSATGGIAPYTWSVASGSLPPGLSLNPVSGALFGTPTAAGTSTFTIGVSDSRQVTTATAGLSLTVSPALQVATPSLPGAEVQVPYSTTLTASGGVPNSTLTWSSGDAVPPAGLTLSSAGVLSGTPTTVNPAATVTVFVSDGVGFAQKTFSLSIASGLSITTTSVPNGVPNQAYTPVNLAVAGGTGPFAWTATGLPAGMSLSSAGVLSGTPTTAAVTPFAVSVSDGVGGHAAAQLSITVKAPLTVTAPTLGAGDVNASYTSPNFAAAGGIGPYTWAVATGTLPPGVSLTPNAGNAGVAVLSGTPTTAGTYTFTLSVTDSLSSVASTSALSIPINAALQIATTSLPAAAMSVPYSAQLAATGGAGSATYTWSLPSAVTLPAGLTLSSAGVLSGTPLTVNPSAAVAVQVADNLGGVAQKSIPLAITAPPPINITSGAALPVGHAGSAYGPLQLQATGGTAANYTWSLVTGAVVPQSLTLSAAGSLGGTLASDSQGSYQFGIGVTDGVSSGSQVFTLTVVPPTPTLQITGLPASPAPNMQPQVTIGVSTKYAYDIHGTLTLTFSSPSGVDDPTIQFTNGSRAFAFTIPAGSTTAAQQPTFLTGTVAGTITLTVTQYQAVVPTLGTVDLTPVPSPAQVQIPASAPVIVSVTATRSGSTVTVTVTGYSTTRDMTSGNFDFLGSNLKQTPQVSLSSLFQGWFGNAASDQFGSQFTLTQPFTVTGNPANVTSVGVTLTNSAGASAVATATVE